MQNDFDSSNFVNSLKSVPPAPAQVDPIAAAFLAGKRAGRRQARFWQIGSLATLALCGALFIHQQPSPKPPESILAASAQQIAPPASDESEFNLQQAVLAHGLDGLAILPMPAAHAVQAGANM